MTPTIGVRSTPGGKIAVTATSGDLSKTSYFVGGYPFYVIQARRVERTWNPKIYEYEDVPSIAIRVWKRTRDEEVARRIARDGGVMFARQADGSYSAV